MSTRQRFASSAPSLFGAPPEFRSSNEELRAPFAWYGGKSQSATWLLQHFPDHRVYIEPFGGAANVLLSKRPSEVEVYNDLDERLVNFFQVLRDPAALQELSTLCTLTPYSRRQFEQLTQVEEPDEPVQRAWWFFVRARQAIGGSGMTKLTPCFWAASIRTRRNMAESVSKYLSAIDLLPEVAARFRTVLIEKLPALAIVDRYDADDTFFYCDPPYLPDTRHPQKATRYGIEMTVEDHVALLQRLLAIRGRAMISGYPSDLYDNALSGWTRAECAVKAQMSNSGQDRTEVIWMNYAGPAWAGRG